jgi:hypothetical protein
MVPLSVDGGLIEISRQYTTRPEGALWSLFLGFAL